MRIGIFGRQLDRLLVALDGAIDLSALGQRAPQVVVTGGIRRICAQRPPVQLNRVVQIVLRVPDDGEPVERLGKRRLQTRAPVETTPRRRCNPAGSAAHARRRSGVPRSGRAARPLELRRSASSGAVRFEVARGELGAQLRVARLYLEPLLVSCDVIAENLRAEVLLEPREIGRPARHDLQPQRAHL